MEAVIGISSACGFPYVYHLNTQGQAPTTAEPLVVSGVMQGYAGCGDVSLGSPGEDAALLVPWTSGNRSDGAGA
jgi:hypothetical protein